MTGHCTFIKTRKYRRVTETCGTGTSCKYLFTIKFKVDGVLAPAVSESSDSRC